MCLIDFHRLHEDLWLFGHEASADLHASNMKIQMRSVTEISLESTDQKSQKKKKKVGIFTKPARLLPTVLTHTDFIKNLASAF